MSVVLEIAAWVVTVQVAVLAGFAVLLAPLMCRSWGRWLVLLAAAGVAIVGVKLWPGQAFVVAAAAGIGTGIVVASAAAYAADRPQRPHGVDEHLLAAEWSVPGHQPDGSPLTTK